MSATLIDLTGKQFDRLNVVEFAGKDKDGHSLWKCQCICGNVKIVRGRHLRRGQIRSCGCLLKETASERIKKHPRVSKERIKGGAKNETNKAELLQ